MNNKSIEHFDGPRACKVYDLGPVLDTANLVMRTLATPPGQPQRLPTIGYDWAHVYNHGNLDNIRLITKNGLAVSSVAVFPGTTITPLGSISVGGINCFVTHPEYRRRGLGEAVLLDAIEKMKINGHHIGLLSTNIEGYYRRYGWESSGRKRQFFLNKGNVDLLSYSPGVQITEDWKPYASQLRDLHEREHLISTRSAEIFPLLFERRLDRVFVATKHGKVEGYVGVKGLEMQEYGGDYEVVESLIHSMFSNLYDPDISASTYAPGEDPTFEMTISCPDSLEGLSGILLRKGIPNTLDYIGMIVILDAPRLFEALNIREISLCQQETGWLLEYGRKTLEVSEHELVKLVFGPELFPDFAPEIFPIEFYQWPLDKV